MFDPIFRSLAWQSIKQNLKYWFVATLLLTLSCIMFISLVIPVFSMGQKLQQINKTQNLEDVNLLASNKLTPNQLKQIKKQYFLNIEENNSKVILLDNKNLSSYLTIEQNFSLNVLDQNNQLTNLKIPKDKYALIINEKTIKINKLFTNSNLKNNELAFDKSSFLQRKYTNNTTLNINNVKYLIKPATLVNHVYPTDELLLPNTKKLAFATLNSSSYRKLKSNYSQITYHGKFTSNLNFKQRNEIYQKLLKSNILKSTKIYKLQDKDLNPNISVPNDKIIGSQMSTFVMVIFITTLSIIIIISLINKLLVKDIETIGVLKALGYENKKIANIYLLFPLTCFIVSALISIIVGPYISRQTMNLYYLFFSIPQSNTFESFFFNIGYLTLVCLALILATRVGVFRVLNKKVLNMLNNVEEKKINPQKIAKIKQKGNFIQQIKYLNFMFNKSLFTYFMFTMFLASSMFYLALSIFNIYGNFTSSDNIYKPQPQQVFKQKQIQKNLPGEFNLNSLLLSKVKDKEISSSNLVNIMGLNKNHPNLKLQKSNNTIASIKNDNDFVISTKLAVFFNLKKGDSITLNEINSQKTFKFTITDIVLLKEDLSVYINNDQFNKLFNNNIKQVMGRFTKDKYNSEQILNNNSNDLIKLSKDFSNVQLTSLITTLMFAIVIAGTMIWVITNNLIFKNKNIIEIMLLLGFTTKEIRKIVITPFNIWVVLIGIITYPIIVIGLNTLFLTNAQTFNMIINVEFNFITWISGFVLYLTTYLLFINLSALKLNRTDISKINKNKE